MIVRFLFSQMLELMLLSIITSHTTNLAIMCMNKDVEFFQVIMHLLLDVDNTAH